MTSPPSKESFKGSLASPTPRAEVENAGLLLLLLLLLLVESFSRESFVIIASSPAVVRERLSSRESLEGLRMPVKSPPPPLLSSFIPPVLN